MGPPALPDSDLPKCSPQTQSVEGPKRWSGVVEGETSFQEISKPVFVLEGGTETVVLPPEIIEDDAPLWKSFVVGYFIGEAPHNGKIHATVNRIWAVSGNPIKIDV
ncbi:unnamed protein product [Thlaspi arvense]|uniref:DUF4283 domain-containing protein n=1 Tax=Thlaspi arvense TaxID=13288 RepID=A0AAU9R856_THLAR|nr:unnamed protein product [Thlaspi arvense]